jgi:GNAT superfamily N-acetyltransferase
MFVKPEFRKQGIGSQLLERAFEEARTANLTLVTCAEPLAYGFFTKQGFQSTKHGDIDLRRWSPDYCGYGVFRITGIYWDPVGHV